MIEIKKIKRIIILVLGFISLGIGCIGVFTPLLPTVPFLLITTYCFSKSSDRFHRWFTGTKLYKKYLSDFVQTRSLSIKKEIILLSGVTLIIMISTILINNTLVSIILPIVILCKYLYFIFQVKTIPGKR